jgi:hypothetical protein
MILINAAVSCANLQYQGYRNALVLGLRDDESSHWANAQSAFDSIEVFFAVVFLIELLIRLAGDKMFLRNITNWLDVIVVLSSLVSLFGMSGGANLTFARLLRVAKLVRVLRIARTMKMFWSLRVLVKTITSSMGILTWSMVLLTLIQMISSLFMCQVLNDVINDESVEMETRMHVYKFYGSSFRAWLTMFEITFAPGAWAKAGRPIIENVHEAWALFFVGYVATVSFAIIRVITAVFLRETLQVANADSELAIADKITQKNKF